MELVFLLSADRDIQTAFNLYEDWQEGRGTIFMQHLDAAFEHVRSFPEIGPVFRGRYRRLLVPRFPYGIFYVIEQNRIIVTAVLDLRQDPKTIVGRVAG